MHFGHVNFCAGRFCDLGYYAKVLKSVVLYITILDFAIPISYIVVN